jgi:hypothetical protein
MRLARFVSLFLLVFLGVLSDRAIGGNWGAGLSAMGEAISDFAGEAAAQQLQHDLEVQKMQLQHDLDMQRMQSQYNLEMQGTNPPPPVAQPPVITATDAYNKGIAAYQRKDYAEALTWYHMAADQGYAAAQNNLGVMYRRGLGVVQDYTEAARWYRVAADQGLASAQYNLGGMNADGHGMPQNYARARYWFGLAAQQGQPDAIRWLMQNAQQSQPTQQPVTVVTPPIAQPSASKIAMLGQIVESYPQYGYVVFQVIGSTSVGVEVLAQSSSGNFLKMLVQKRVRNNNGTLMSAMVPNGISQLSKGDKVVQPTP